jgi:hypothetical protein
MGKRKNEMIKGGCHFMQKGNGCKKIPELREARLAGVSSIFEHAKVSRHTGTAAIDLSSLTNKVTLGLWIMYTEMRTACSSGSGFLRSKCTRVRSSHT